MADAPPLATTAEQCRVARRLLGWSQEALAERAGLIAKTISAFERGPPPARGNTTALIARALEAGGIEFTDGDEPGVRDVRGTASA